MKQKFLRDLGIDLDGSTEDLLQQFDIKRFMDEISDNRLKKKKKKVEELTKKIQEEEENKDNK